MDVNTPFIFTKVHPFEPLSKSMNYLFTAKTHEIPLESYINLDVDLTKNAN